MVSPNERRNTPEPFVYRGNVAEVIDRLTTEWVGLGVFAAQEVETVVDELIKRGFVAREPGGQSLVTSGDQQRTGELHRHGNNELIVHRTPEGRGTVNFYWPVDDTYEFYPGHNEVQGEVTDLVYGPETVLVFPSHTWHQFNTDSHQARLSTFKHFVPGEIA